MAGERYFVDGKGFKSLKLVAYYVGISEYTASLCFHQMGNSLNKEQMLAFKKRASPTRRPAAFYFGKKMVLDDIATAEGVTKRQMYDWWKRNGRPTTITPEHLVKIRYLTTKAEGIYTLLPDGTRHGGRELSEMFGLSHSAVSNRSKQRGQTVFTREELTAMSGRSYKASAPAKEPAVRTRPRSIHDVEYHPSAMERAIMGIR